VKIGDLVRFKRNGKKAHLWIVASVCQQSYNIGLWSSRVNHLDDLRWTYADALELVSENR